MATNEENIQRLLIKDAQLEERVNASCRAILNINKDLKSILDKVTKIEISISSIRMRQGLLAYMVPLIGGAIPSVGVIILLCARGLL